MREYIHIVQKPLTMGLIPAELTTRTTALTQLVDCRSYDIGGVGPISNFANNVYVDPIVGELNQLFNEDSSYIYCNDGSFYYDGTPISVTPAVTGTEAWDSCMVLGKVLATNDSCVILGSRSSILSFSNLKVATLCEGDGRVFFGGFNGSSSFGTLSRNAIAWTGAGYQYLENILAGTAIPENEFINGNCGYLILSKDTNVWKLTFNNHMLFVYTDKGLYIYRLTDNPIPTPALVRYESISIYGRNCAKAYAEKTLVLTSNLDVVLIDNLSMRSITVNFSKYLKSLKTNYYIHFNTDNLFFVICNYDSTYICDNWVVDLNGRLSKLSTTNFTDGTSYGYYCVNNYLDSATTYGATIEIANIDMGMPGLKYMTHLDFGISGNVANSMLCTVSSYLYGNTYTKQVTVSDALTSAFIQATGNLFNISLACDYTTCNLSLNYINIHYKTIDKRFKRGAFNADNQTEP